MKRVRCWLIIGMLCSPVVGCSSAPQQESEMSAVEEPADGEAVAKEAVNVEDSEEARADEESSDGEWPEIGELVALKEGPAAVIDGVELGEEEVWSIFEYQLGKKAGRLDIEDAQQARSLERPLVEFVVEWWLVERAADKQGELELPWAPEALPARETDAGDQPALVEAFGLTREQLFREALAGGWLPAELEEFGEFIPEDSWLEVVYEAYLDENEDVDEVDVSILTLHYREDDRERVTNRIEEIHEQLVEGNDFAELAREHSENFYVEEGGRMGWASPEDLIPEVGEAVSGPLQSGEFSAPLDTGHSFVLVKVHDIRRATPVEFEAFGDEDDRLLWVENAEEAFDEYVEVLRDQADLQVYPDRVVIDGEKFLQLNERLTLDFEVDGL